MLTKHDIHCFYMQHCYNICWHEYTSFYADIIKKTFSVEDLGFMHNIDKGLKRYTSIRP